MAIRSLLLRLVPLLLVTGCSAASVEVDPRGGQRQGDASGGRPRQVKATFVNAGDAAVNLYWAGNAGRANEGSLQLYYGPLENGGERTIDGFEGQVFVMTEVGGYERLGEYKLGASDASAGAETHVLTDESASEFRDLFPPKEDSNELERQQRCRSINADHSADDSSTFLDRCQRCVQVSGCGFSPVRDRQHQKDGEGIGGCYISHSVASINDAEECESLASVEQAKAWTTAKAWLKTAKDFTLEGVNAGYESRALRMAYRSLEMAVERSRQMVTDAHAMKDEGLVKAVGLDRRATAALSELTAKLEAVFDDVDAEELLASSRHPKLAEVHPNMPAVPRRKASEAIQYVLRGEPVVITDLLDDTPNPVAHKWSLEYLNKEVFSAGDARGELPKFNVATDAETRCCRYFEPQGKAKQAGYPYPFEPTTHLYRDTFGGFVDTVRNTANTSESHPLHYLHEIVMNKDGRAVVAGGEAPRQLAADLDAVTSQLRPMASKQPFFGDFAYAKVWLGQQGIVMPIHYDATDNLYVMAWGRKRAIIGEPGQLDALYRYPNGHPLVGSSQVNLTDPDMEQFPHFKDAKLREVIVGPGDVLYLPAWWWHQFEQPFEDTAALNIWSRDREQAPASHMHSAAVREHILADNLEAAVVQVAGKDAGIVFDALANGESSPYYASVGQDMLTRANNALLDIANKWKGGVSQLPGGHPKTKQSAASLVEEHLDRTHRAVIQGVDSKGWQPGAAWDLSNTSALPRELRSRCEAASEASPFMSICR